MASNVPESLGGSSRRRRSRRFHPPASARPPSPNRISPLALPRPSSPRANSPPASPKNRPASPSTTTGARNPNNNYYRQPPASPNSSRGRPPMRAVGSPGVGAGASAANPNMWFPWFSDSNTSNNNSSSGPAPTASSPQQQQAAPSPPLFASSPSRSWDSGDDPLPVPKMTPIVVRSRHSNTNNSNSWIMSDDNCSVQSCDVLAMGGSSSGFYQNNTRQHHHSPPPPRIHLLPLSSSCDRSVMSDTQLDDRTSRRLLLGISSGSSSTTDRHSRRAMALQAAHQRIGAANNNNNMSFSSLRSGNRALDEHQRAQQQAPPPQTHLSMPLVVPDDDVSSLGGIEDQNLHSASNNCSSSPSLMRIALAIKNKSARRPSSLTPDERALWDTVQRALEQASAGSTAATSVPSSPETPPPQNPLTSDSSVASSDSWESRYNHVQELAVEQRKESQRSLMAIQRVLADTTEQRDKALLQLRRCHSSPGLLRPMTARRTAAAAASSSDDDDGYDDDDDDGPLLTPWQEEMAVLQKQLDHRDARVAALERELAAVKQESSSRQTDREPIHNSTLLEETKAQVASLQGEKTALLARVESKSEEISVLMRRVHDADRSNSNLEAAAAAALNSDEIAMLRKELKDRTSALESAKMIITSLEHASGSHAADMRNKLKSREDELSRLKAEALDRKKMMDSLALELRDSRKAEANRSRISAEERDMMAAAIARLDKNMAEIRSAVVIFEATQDAAAVEKMSDIFGDSLATLRERMEALDCVEERYGDIDSVNSSCSELGSRRTSEEKRLRRELDEKNSSLRRLEDELQRQKEENEKARSEAEKMQQRHDEDTQKHQTEIQNLRSQYGTIMTVLARKERELVVLRDSLKVDDDVGYISDDATEGDEEDENSPVLSAPAHLDTSLYGPSQTEALATLLAHGGGAIDVGNSAASGQVEALKCQLLQSLAENEQARKQLKMEKESLANAKMIISSLEKANKSMREDLRSRLHDSNTAIASLLEKSVGSDKTTAQLRQNLETLQREKEHEKEKFRTEIERLRYGIGSSPWSSAHQHNSMEENKELMLTETID